MPDSTIPTAAAVIKEAAKHIGYREGPNNDNIFGEFYGANNTAWCAQFIYYCVRKAGAEKGQLIPKTAWCPDLLAFARDHELTIRDPARNDRTKSGFKAGDILLIQRPGQPDGAKHVAFVEKDRSDGKVQTIEGNTNDSGSAQGVGVFRLVRTLNDLSVVFRPKYPASAQPLVGGSAGSQPAKVVDLSKIIAAAKRDSGRPQGGTTPGAADDVRIVEDALRREGLLSEEFAGDGSFGSLTVDAYAAWQRECGFTGDDADGIPGRESLEKLGKKYGFSVAD